jgi:hypothetical protein
MKFSYMMLSRLVSDCKYYSRHPHPKHLWAGNVIGQITEMKRLWNELPLNKKPEWLSMEDILEWEIKLK